MGTWGAENATSFPEDSSESTALVKYSAFESLFLLFFSDKNISKNIFNPLFFPWNHSSVPPDLRESNAVTVMPGFRAPF